MSFLGIFLFELHNLLQDFLTLSSRALCGLVTLSRSFSSRACVAVWVDGVSVKSSNMLARSRSLGLRPFGSRMRALSTAFSSDGYDQPLTPPARAAECFMGAWSDDDGFGCGMRYPAIRREAELPDLSSLQDVFETHDHMLQSPHCQRLGGFGGYKLGWKNNPLIAADPLRLHAMYSPIFAGCFFPSGAEISLSHHKVFAAEAEYGFVMRHTLLPRDEAYTAEEVWAAVHWVEPVIEIIGARLASFSGANTSPYHLLADAMSNALVVRGAPISSFTSDYPPPEALTGGSWRVQLRVDNREVSSGIGSENPADSPLGSLTFLVNDLVHRRRRALEAGALVIAGHTCQVAFSGARALPPAALTLPQAQVCGARVVPEAAVEFGSHTVLEAYFEGCGTVRATLVE